MRCPGCGSEIPDGEISCGNCGRKKLGWSPACRETDEVLARHEFGPLVAPLQDRETRVYKDKVVTESRSHITSARVVGTVSRRYWSAVNIFAIVFMFVFALVFIGLAGVMGNACPLLFALIFIVFGSYGLYVYLKLEPGATQKKDE